jgi:uncharacterized protein (TIGR00162 family)
MNEPYIRVVYQPDLENIVLVCGLPGLGNVGKIAAHLLIESIKAELFAELYSPSFPDYVLIDEKGICRPPRYEFYASETQDRDFIVLTGDVQPPMEDILAHYEVCGKVLDFVADYGCKLIVTLGGAMESKLENEVYVAATSQKIAKDYVEKGAAIYEGGRIIGASGILVGLAKERGIDAVCLLGSTRGLTVDKDSALYLYKFLVATLEIDI